MLSKSQIADRLVQKGLGQRQHITNILNGLAQIAAEEIERGEDFVVPGIVSLKYQYRPAVKKGERWKKGDTVTGFGGLESVKDADSPPVARRVTLKASPVGQVGKLKPSTNAEKQKEFLTTKTAKAVIKRKS